MTTVRRSAKKQKLKGAIFKYFICLKKKTTRIRFTYRGRLEQWHGGSCNHQNTDARVGQR